jgi:hypothetical protein
MYEDGVEEMPPARPFGLPQSASPWRIDIEQRIDEIAARIGARAEPEQRFAIARQLAEDLLHLVKAELKQEHGRIFDRVMDGTSVRIP